MRSTNAAILLEALRAFLAQHQTPGPWVVAYSGGRDSGVLLWALSRLALPGQLEALHVDHGWRPPEERAQEASLVESWCRGLGVPLVSYGPPPAPLKTEAEARSFRYSCFEDHAAKRPGAVFWLAHHADDQAETVLMRLLKGRSWQGLAGMSGRRGRYLRPLLGLRARVLAGAAQEEGIPFHTDSTNAEARLLRNYLRLEVFPVLESRFPRAVSALGDFARTWRQVAPRGERDPGWTATDRGAVLPASLWDRWSVPERQAQLLAWVQGEARVPARRLLEAAAADGRRTSVQGGGWRWSRAQDRIRWEKVVQRTVKEYFISAGGATSCALGDLVLVLSPEPTADGFALEGIDPERPWYWRTVVPGMRLASSDGGAWDPARRRRRLGSPRSDSTVLAIQDGLVRAVVDLEAKALRWGETGAQKLHKGRIFVTLVERSDYERR